MRLPWPSVNGHINRQPATRATPIPEAAQSVIAFGRWEVRLRRSRLEAYKCPVLRSFIFVTALFGIVPPGLRPPSRSPGAVCRAARTPWGNPDLQGTYTNKSEQSTPLERPARVRRPTRRGCAGVELADVLEKRNRK